MAVGSKHMQEELKTMKNGEKEWGLRVQTQLPPEAWAVYLISELQSPDLGNGEITPPAPHRFVVLHELKDVKIQEQKQ